MATDYEEAKTWRLALTLLAILLVVIVASTTACQINRDREVTDRMRLNPDYGHNWSVDLNR